MSGSRKKALWRAFIRKHKRPPRGPAISKGPAMGPSMTLDAKGKKRPWIDVVKIAASRFKRMILPVAETPHHPEAETKHHARAKRKLGPSEPSEMFVRKLFSVAVTEPSEWRRWKKQYRWKKQ